MIPLAGDVGAYEVEVEQRFPKCFQVPFFFLSEGSHQQRIIFFMSETDSNLLSSWPWMMHYFYLYQYVLAWLTWYLDKKDNQI